MALDINGIWQYQETDPASPASDLLNLLAASTSDAVADLSTRAAALEADWPVAGALVLAAGWEYFDPAADPIRFTVVGGWVLTTGGNVRRSAGNTLALTAGASQAIGTWDTSVIPDAPASMRIPSMLTQVRGTATTTGLLFTSGAPQVLRVDAAAATTLTGGSTSQYIPVPPMQWIKAV